MCVLLAVHLVFVCGVSRGSPTPHTHLVHNPHIVHTRTRHNITNLDAAKHTEATEQSWSGYPDRPTEPRPNPPSPVFFLFDLSPSFFFVPSLFFSSLFFFFFFFLYSNSTHSLLPIHLHSHRLISLIPTMATNALTNKEVIHLEHQYGAHK